MPQLRVPKAEDEPEKRAWELTREGRNGNWGKGEAGEIGNIFTNYNMVHSSHLNMNYTPTYQYVGYLH